MVGSGHHEPPRLFSCWDESRPCGCSSVHCGADSDCNPSPSPQLDGLTSGRFIHTKERKHVAKPSFGAGWDGSSPSPQLHPHPRGASHAYLPSKGIFLLEFLYFTIPSSPPTAAHLDKDFLSALLEEGHLQQQHLCLQDALQIAACRRDLGNATAHGRLWRELTHLNSLLVFLITAGEEFLKGC